MTPTARPAQRQRLLAARMAVAPTQRRAWDTVITRRLIETFPVHGPLVVGLYWPFKGEFDPRVVARHWREAGARTALPVVVQKGAPLEFRAWWPGVPTRPGVFDLPVPVDTPVLQPDLLLIPPVGFDARGYRLGYGGGYYDRTLAGLPPMVRKIGVAFELSRMDDFVPQAHDVPMDVIVTEAGIFYPTGV